MISPTISVVVPVYNVAPYVERCMRSVMRQSYPAAECIIVNDASTDCSIAICQRLIVEYSGPTRFVIFHHGKNRGLSATRNTGTNAAASDYIYYLDSDDELTPDCLEKMVAPCICDDSIEMVMGGHVVDYTAMSGLSSWFLGKRARFVNGMPEELKSNDEVRQWFYNQTVSRPVNVWNKLLKLSFIKENGLYNKEGQLWEDQLWAFYLMRHLNHAAFVPSVTYICYRHPGSIVTETGKEEMLRQMGYIYKEISSGIKPGEHIEETVCWLRDFCRFYVDASDNEDYKFAYNAFLRQLSDGKHEREIQRLKRAQRMAKKTLGRILYRNISRVSRHVTKFLGCYGAKN